jgi:hypothetical protein
MSDKTTIEQQTRQQIAEFLPEAIELAFASYKKFMQDGPKEKQSHENSKGTEFIEHHKSAKVAISHIELLIKLAKWADLPDGTVLDSQRRQYFEGLMEKATAEIEAFGQDDNEDME